MPGEFEREALVVGNLDGLIWALPHLLCRAGFAVDVIATSPLMRSSKFVREMRHVRTVEDLMETAFDRICTRARPYDWVIAGDDMTLRSLAHFSWPDSRRPLHLSIDRADGVDHIYSKIGLSRAFAAGGVQTPPFHVAGHWQEAAAWASHHGFPVLLKVDVSTGGLGVHECNCVDVIEKLGHLFASKQVLVQKKIAGPEIDLTAIYFDHRLVHFSYARVDKAGSAFGPSLVRTFYPLPLVNANVFAELNRLGRVLRASGFANISCIDAADGSGRYYFEADLRPNAWTYCPTFFGEDPAAEIRGWFNSRTCLTPQSAARQGSLAPVTIPCFLRMPAWGLLANRHRVWKYIPVADTRVVMRLLLRASIVRSAKVFVPRSLQIKLNAWRSCRRFRRSRV